MIPLPRPHGLALAILTAAFALTAASPVPHARAVAATAGLSAWMRGFEANVGQTDRGAQFLTRTPAGPLLLTSTGAVRPRFGRSESGRFVDGGLVGAVLGGFRLKAPTRLDPQALSTRVPGGRVVVHTLGAFTWTLEPPSHPRSNPESFEHTRSSGPPALSTALRVAFASNLDAKSRFQVRVDEDSKTTVSLANRGSVEQAVFVPSFELLNVSPGIDARFKKSQGQFEFDWIVHPAGEVSTIRLTVPREASAAVLASGDLSVRLGTSAFRIARPVAYQRVSGEQRPVACSYTLHNKHTIGVQVAEYDRKVDLIVDPILVGSTFVGGEGSDFVVSVAVASGGDVLMAGSVANEALLGQVFGSGGSSPNGFVARLDSDLQRVQRLAILPGSLVRDMGFAGGSVWLTGIALNGSFPTTPDAVKREGSHSSDGDCILVRMDSETLQLTYSTRYGGRSLDVGEKLCRFSDGSIGVAGTTNSEDFPISGGFQSSLGGMQDLFVARFDPEGKFFRFATYLGGVEFEEVRGFAAGADDVSLVSMQVFSGQVDRRVIRGQLARISGDGARLLGVDLPGEHRAPFAGWVAVAPGGDILVRRFLDAPQPVIGGPNPRNTILRAVIDRLDPTGTRLVGTLLPPERFVATSLALDGRGRWWLAGAQFTQAPPSYEIRTLKMDFSTGEVLSSFTFGGSGSDSVLSLAISPNGDALIAGGTNSLDFPVRKPLQSVHGDAAAPSLFPQFDGFIARISFDPPAGPSPRLALGFTRGFLRMSLRGSEGACLADRRTLGLALSNPGAVPVSVTVGELRPPFTVQSGGGTFTIPPRSRRRVEIHFQPDRPGIFHTQLPITSDDPRHALTHIRLVGTATR